MRVRVRADRTTARHVLALHLAGKIHHESREAARDEVWRRGRTPAAEPVFVGVTNGRPVYLLYEVEVCSDTMP